MNELCDYGVDEGIIKKISRQSGIPYADPGKAESVFPAGTQPEKRGIFGALLVGMALKNDSRHKGAGKCSGDCANCPPHYGYRYGRWYYGHGHTHGCEFGGNGNGKCSID